MATPYIITKEARAVARRIRKMGLLELSWLVQLLPLCIKDVPGVNYVVRYCASEQVEESISQIHFMESKKGSKSAAFIDQLQEFTDWKWWAYVRNEDFLSFLPTLANTRWYNL